MRTGLITDIHGNLEALQAVLHLLEKQRVDEVVCLGDVVGYGADPEACCALVRQRTSICLLGNHDAAVCGRMDLGFFYDAARDAVLMHRYQVSPETLEWMRGLPYQALSRAGNQVLAYCHGDPVDPPEYGYIISAKHVQACAEVRTDLRPARAVFFGHSHLPRAFKVLPSGRAKLLTTEGKILLRPDRQYYFSVGSVGQPRDFDVRAACAVYDADRQVFEFHRVEYDIDAAADKIMAAGLPHEFALRLYRGV